MTPIYKIVIALAGICLAIVFGTSCVHSTRARLHYSRLCYYGRNDMHADVVSEYHKLPKDIRNAQPIKTYYDEARQIVGDSSGEDLLPTTESLDVAAFVMFALGLFVMLLSAKPRKQKIYSMERPTAQPDSPTAGQIEFIRRFNNGIIPVGLTKSKAAAMIKSHLANLSAMSKRQKLDVSPVEFMSGSKSYREKMRIERERKRAREKLERQMEQERRKRERDEERERKAVDRLYEKRIAEEEKLIKARNDADKGVVHKARTAKARTIQELQDLVNDILADKKIEPQEIRQLKAWLIVNKQSPDDFAQMIKLIDESLVDGIIDGTETQAIYEGVIDCLITLRERRST